MADCPGKWSRETGLEEVPQVCTNCKFFVWVTNSKLIKIERVVSTCLLIVPDENHRTWLRSHIKIVKDIRITQGECGFIGLCVRLLGRNKLHCKTAKKRT